MSSSISVINEVMEAVIALMNATSPFATVTRGALTTGNSLTAEVAPSAPDRVFMDKNSYVFLDVTMNGKHHSLKTLSEAMNKIHSTLTRSKTYTADTTSNRWQIVDITNKTLPQIIGREDNQDWLMASSLSVKFYWEGD